MVDTRRAAYSKNVLRTLDPTIWARGVRGFCQVSSSGLATNAIEGNPKCALKKKQKKPPLPPPDALVYLKHYQDVTNLLTTT